MARSNWLLSGAAALLALAPGAAPANGLYDAPAAQPASPLATSGSGPRATPAYALRVDDQWTASSPDGCQQTTHVYGAMLEIAPTGLPLGVGNRYLPEDLRLDARVQCPGGGGGSVVNRQLQSAAPLSRPALAQWIQNTARVSVAHVGRQCSYAPVVAMNGAWAESRGVASECVARGGGPATEPGVAP